MINPFQDTLVSRFPNSFTSQPLGEDDLAAVLESIRDGRYADQITHVRRLLDRQGKAAYDRAKAQLPAFTFGGTFSPKRGNQYLQRHSGLVHGDLDHLIDLAAVQRALCADPRTVYVFISPSATGLKLGVRVATVPDDAGYKHAWQVVSAAYERLYDVPWDPSGKDIARLCFTSHAPDLYLNLDAELFDVPPPAPPKTEPRPLQPVADRRHHSPRDFAERAIQTAVQMIQSAPMGTRHPTRLRAARLLGGYVAGGLLSEEHAYGVLAQALVGHTEDLTRALKTVEDGLAYGQEHPITLDALESERQAWLTQHRQGYQPRHHQPPSTDPWAGHRTLPLRPYGGLRMPRREVHRG
jgi:VirE N-terminal domain